MSKGTCSIQGCLKPARKRGWCEAHYVRWWKYGDPHYLKPISDPSLEERFWSRVQIGESCWEWSGARIKGGYACIRYHRKLLTVHRVSYELHKGPIPEGLTIDHLCRNRGCVNPDHLEAVTMKTNVKRGQGNGYQLNAAKTHCPEGHPYDEANTYRTPGNTSRHCRTCQKERRRRRGQIHS